MPIPIPGIPFLDRIWGANLFHFLLLHPLLGQSRRRQGIHDCPPFLSSIWNLVGLLGLPSHLVLGIEAQTATQLRQQELQRPWGTPTSHSPLRENPGFPEGSGPGTVSELLTGLPLPLGMFRLQTRPQPGGLLRTETVPPINLHSSHV